MFFYAEKDVRVWQRIKLNLDKKKRLLKVMTELKSSDEVTTKDLELINQYIRKELTAEEVYAYPIVLTFFFQKNNTPT